VHAVVAHFDGDEVTVHDPARPGPDRMTFEEYRRDHGGFAVVVD